MFKVGDYVRIVPKGCLGTIIEIDHDVGGSDYLTAYRVEYTALNGFQFKMYCMADELEMIHARLFNEEFDLEDIELAEMIIGEMK